MKKPVTKPFKLPPTEFSNAMNLIYGPACGRVGFDWQTWETSKEWRLWNAGRASGYRDINLSSKVFAEDCERVVRL